MSMAKGAAAMGLTAAFVLGGAALSGCATEDYVDQQVATLNGRIDGVDSKAGAAQQRADAAAAAAQAAAGDAQSANQRLDQLTTRVDGLEARARTPRN
jgi:outer membrane murein-binding lipoprotein Lpp